MKKIFFATVLSNIIMILNLFSCNAIIANDVVVMELNGESEIYLHIGDEYHEDGATVTVNEIDYSSEIQIQIFNKLKVEVEEVETTVVDEFSIIYTFLYKNKEHTASRKVTVEEDIDIPIVQNDDLSIHFLEVGNQYTGDSIYIKAGETDILIDAGSRKGSASAISTYLDNFVIDDKLEFVIATHAHQDHIAGFVGNSNGNGILPNYQVDTLIDFGLTNSTTVIYSDYVAARGKKIAEGTKYYTQNECFYEQNGAQREYEIAEGVTLEILYNYYGEFGNKKTDENDFSVCVMIKQGDKNFLLTGDLEEAGEKELVKNNELPEVELFKAGHHGSYTATSLTLLDVIKPKIICVCCCAGSTEYTTNKDRTFPAQDFINRAGLYTELIYVTTVIGLDGKTPESLNGNIVVFSNNEETTVTGSNHSTILKETDWFLANRVWPVRQTAQ